MATIYGTIYDDDWDSAIFGTVSNDHIYGLSGNDWINSSGGNDLIDGGSGSDVVTYGSSLSGVFINNTSTYYSGVSPFTVSKFDGTDTLVGIESFDASHYDDRAILADNGSGAGYVFLRSGNDYVQTLSGYHYIIPGSGNDTIIGGSDYVEISYEDGGWDVAGNPNPSQTSGIQAYFESDESGVVSNDGWGCTDIFQHVFQIGGSNLSDNINAQQVTLLSVRFFGLDGNDTLIGGGGQDSISGDDGDDRISGNSGNDALSGGTGADFLNGGNGGDFMSGGAGRDSLYGGDAGYDMLNYFQEDIEGGSHGVIVNLSGKSISVDLKQGAGVQLVQSGTAIDAFGDKDIVKGFEEARGTDYADYIVLGGLDGGIFGYSGDDTLIGGNGWNWFSPGEGDDIINGVGAGNSLSYLAETEWDEVHGEHGVLVNMSNAAIQADIGQGSGLQTVQQSTAIDSYGTVDKFSNITDIAGSIYSDYIVGSSASNNLQGNSSNDSVFGGSGNDALDGGNGDDILEGGVGNDGLTGGYGVDTASYKGSSAAVSVNLGLTSAQNTIGAGTDTLNSIENLIGSAYNDALTGNGSANNLSGSTGNDSLIGNAGNDTLDGGAGNDALTGSDGTDTVSYANSTSAVTVSLALTTSQVTGGAGTDTLLTIENLIGSGFNDFLTGNSNVNKIEGGAGNDKIYGGLGNDTLVGGAGSDVFVFNTTPNASTNKDTISDFVSANDDFWLSKTAMAGLGSSTGQLSSAKFWSGAGVTASHDADDRVIYNSTTGALYYDADGNGSTAAVQIAQLTANTVLTYQDFFII